MTRAAPARRDGIMADTKNKAPIIIKRVKKGHGGHHGGAWKVAYADFVTAMMAFFLLMWLLNTSPTKTKLELANYFQKFSLFTSGGGATIMNVRTGGASVQGGVSSDDSTTGEAMDRPTLSSGILDEPGRSVGEVIRLAVADELGGDAGEQILVDRTEGGLRIQITDGDGRSLFELGKATPRPLARRLLGVIARSIASLPNPIVVEGHTDSYGFRNGGGYTNWELSADRANAVRRLLVEAGVPAGRIVRVSGLAHTDPLIPDVPMDPRNRRISIILLDRKPGSGDGAFRDVEPEQIENPGSIF